MRAAPIADSCKSATHVVETQWIPSRLAVAKLFAFKSSLISMNYITGRPPFVSGGRCWLKSEQRSFVITGLPVRPSHKFGFRSSVSKNGLPGEGRHEGLVPRNDVFTNGFMWFSLARTLARILFVPRLRSPWKTHKALRTWRRLLERVVQILKSAIKQAHLTNADEDTVSRHPSPTTPHQPSATRHPPPVTRHPPPATRGKVLPLFSRPTFLEVPFATPQSC